MCCGETPSANWFSVDHHQQLKKPAGVQYSIFQANFPTQSKEDSETKKQ